METTTQTIQLIQISAENLQKAKTSVEEMATRRKLVINGTISTLVPVVYPSYNKQKEFRKALARVIMHPTMKSTNIYLHKLHKLSGEEQAEVDYSPKEKAIKKARKEWKESLAIMFAKKEAYQMEKGDFYKS